MRSEYLISVIMSVYNEKESVLRMSMDSILKQTYDKIEFIVVLDKPDNIVAQRLIEDYEKKDNRVKKIINNKNIGLANSLNRAIEVAKGEYIARMDADDISVVDRLESQLMYSIENQIDILGGGIEYIDEDGATISKFNNIYSGQDKIKKILKVSDIVYHPTWLVKANVYKELNGYNNIHACEDYEFLLRALIKNKRIDNLNKLVLKYRITNSSISRSNSLKQLVTSEYIKDVYLKRNNKKLDGLNNYLEKKVVEKDLINYDKSRKYIKIATEKYRIKNYSQACAYSILSLCYSRYAILKIYIILLTKIKSKTIHY